MRKTTFGRRTFTKKQDLFWPGFIMLFLSHLLKLKKESCLLWIWYFQRSSCKVFYELLSDWNVQFSWDENQDCDIDDDPGSEPDTPQVNTHLTLSISLGDFTLYSLAKVILTSVGLPDWLKVTEHVLHILCKCILPVYETYRRSAAWIRRHSLCPPGKNWPCVPRPPYVQWRHPAGRSCWRRPCCGSAWGRKSRKEWLTWLERGTGMPVRPQSCALEWIFVISEWSQSQHLNDVRSFRFEAGWTHWWQLCQSHWYLGLTGRKSVVPWFFTFWGNRRRTLKSMSLTAGP